CPRQASRGGEALQEFLVVRDHGLGASLLQHDLRNQDLVRVAGLAPGEIPLCDVVPCGQPGRERRLHYFGGSKTCTNSASTRNRRCSSSFSNSMASNSGLSGFMMILTCPHSSSPRSSFSLVYCFTV